MDFTIVIPFYNGQAYIDRLLASIPNEIRVLVVDDQSDTPYETNQYTNVTVFRMEKKGYFTGAVNYGVNLCNNDVLILNQDTHFTTDDWLKLIAKYSLTHGLFGEKTPPHPAWPLGYIHGTFMYIRRDVVRSIGLLNERDYPLWGSTCEYQLRAVRAGFKVQAIRPIKGFNHARRGNFGSGIKQLLSREPEKASLLIRTPPEISVIVPCFNHGRYVKDLIGSLVGGDTCLGQLKQQSFASFEVIIVDDASTDDTRKHLEQVIDPLKGISVIYLDKNGGTAKALNVAAQAAHGKYLTVINADDMRKTNALETLYRAQLENPHSFIYDNIVAFNKGQLRPDIKLGVSEFDFEALLKQNHIHTGIMLPKQAWEEVGGWPEIMNDGREDWAMNVRLGVNGWCGKLIPNVGYYYRREGQNRTLVNTTPAKREEYLAKIVSLYPNIYKGERPMSCCGGSKRKSKPAVITYPARTTQAPPTPKVGMVTVEYVGANHGTQSFYGPVTLERYTAGLSKRLINVDERDLHSDNANTPGILDYRAGNGGKLFRRYKPA